MKRTFIGSLDSLVGSNVTVCGWIDTVRSQKKMLFVVIRDHTGSVQAIHPRQGPGDRIEETIEKLTTASTAIITGKLIANEQVKLRGLEIQIEQIEISGDVAASLPISDESSLDTKLDWRFLDLREPRNNLIFRVQTTIEQAMREFWIKNDFIEIHSPKLMSSPSESGAELFEVKYFDRTAYLAQSPQWYKQMAMAAGFERVFEIGPVFRANPSFTSRHDTEFTSVDMEMSWIESHEDVMVFEEQWLQYVLQAVQDKHGQEIKELFGVEVVVPVLPFPRVTMKEARAMVKASGQKIPTEEQADLDHDGELTLARLIQEKTGHQFVFVTEFPSSIRPFYHMRPEGNPKLTNSFDLLWKGFEITTGAQREHRYHKLIEQIKEKGLTIKPLQYYVDFFRFGMPPHGGFGFGLTRMLMVLFEVKNVREVTYLYRGPNRLSP